MATTKRKSLGSMFSVPEDDTVAATAIKTQARPDRIGKKQALFHLPEAAKKQLAILAIEMEKTQHALMAEALNDLFKKYGRPPIA